MPRRLLNPRLDPTRRWPVPPRGPLEYHRSLPGYQPTTLRDAPKLAAAAGIAGAVVKQESDRFGLPAFKVLGASWALSEAMAEGARPERLVAATDGNHGRGVARVARWRGLAARIFVPSGTARARIDAIAGEGAEVVVVEGTYDDAVTAAADDARDHGGLLVQDHAWPGYADIPRRIAEGYATIFWELEEQRAASPAPPFSLVLAPVGVGALAAAIVHHFRREGVACPPRLVSVEPDGAACALASAEAGRIVTLAVGAHASVMAGLNCGTPSSVAWPDLEAGIDEFLSVADARAHQAMRILARDGIAAGETGAACAAGLLELAAQGALAATTRALVLVTEGPTDPGTYRAVLERPD